MMGRRCDACRPVGKAGKATRTLNKGINRESRGGTRNQNEMGEPRPASVQHEVTGVKEKMDLAHLGEWPGTMGELAAFGEID